MIEWTNDRMIEWLIEWSKSTDRLSTDQKIEWSNDRKIEYRMIDISPADQPAGSVRCRLSMWWVSKFVHIVKTIALGALCAQQLGIIKSTRRWPSGCSGKDRHYIIVCYSHYSSLSSNHYNWFRFCFRNLTIYLSMTWGWSNVLAWNMSQSNTST